MERKLFFHLCEADETHRYALLCDQPEVKEKFDEAYRITHMKYKEAAPQIKTQYTVTSQPFKVLEDTDKIHGMIEQALETATSELLKGVHVLFCSFNFAVTDLRPILEKTMATYVFTDFVSFSTNEPAGFNPATEPYVVSYAFPRSADTRLGIQHRINCQVSLLAFSIAFHTILLQNRCASLDDSPTPNDLDSYLYELPLTKEKAQKTVDEFSSQLLKLSGNF